MPEAPEAPGGTHSTETMMTMRALLATAILSLSIGALPAAADTPDEVCALDSLRLVSPASLEIALSTTGRFGAQVSWPVIDDVTSTCAVPIDTAGLGFLVTLDGAYRDDFDRELLWNSLFGGEVGSPTENSVLISWSNLNQSVTGRILGEVNLSNNGGVLAFGEDGVWSQANAGLPPYLSKVDVNVLAEAPTSPGTLLATLSDRLNRGLWLKPGPESDWRRLAPELFPDGSLNDSAVSALVFAPDDALTFLVGTSKSGVFLTRDGGLTFTQQQAQFSPAGTWNLRRVTDIVWNRPGGPLRRHQQARAVRLRRPRRVLREPGDAPRAAELPDRRRHYDAGHQPDRRPGRAPAGGRQHLRSL
ncbi:MAG: hypothetical protein IPI34_01830 [bacterium]|nr:hypothetical protein [bacterium]